MNIQSLSVVVPSNGCINDCKFCCVKMSQGAYKNQLDFNLPFYDLYLKDYKERLAFARDNGCNTVMITGDSEPQQNRQFLQFFGMANSELDKPFRNIEIQTTGTRLDDGYLRFLRNHVGVKTISISVSSFDDDENNAIIGTRGEGSFIHLSWLCSEIVKYDFNLRLSINLLNTFDKYFPDRIFAKAKELGANQMTFRVMYMNDEKCPQNDFLAKNNGNPAIVRLISDYVRDNGRPLERLEYGRMRYSVGGISTVIDDDCMATASDKDAVKYLILRPNCKLYSKWDDMGSIVF
jgi:molybdenum cofactor biosynthesis enzyme MoaA